MPNDSTVTEWALPWDRPSEASQELWHLVIAWSLDEPHRVGEAAVVSEAGVLGRGDVQANDPAPRLVFARHRPGHSSPQPPLGSARVSRTQLLVTATSADALSIENRGRCPLVFRGGRVPHADIRANEVISLQNSLVLLAVRRRVPLASLLHYPAKDSFPFGAADPHGLVGESPPMWKLRDELAAAARSDSHVLVLGPSGSGKELAARALHGMSSRSPRDLVSRNAATLPDSLLDAELFGNIRDYPNPGMPARPGLVGQADGSTLFLDEIGELGSELQAHLLRLLDRGGEYQCLGDARPRHADVRFIGATNRPAGALKADFLARFRDRVAVPSLSDRREDIALLVRHTLQRLSQSDRTLSERFLQGSPAAGGFRMAPELIARLVTHDYQDEIRELERLLLLAARTSRGRYIEVTEELLESMQNAAPSSQAAPPADPVPTALTREDVEQALRRTRGNMTEAARILGLKNRFALYRLKKQLAGEDPSSRE